MAVEKQLRMSDGQVLQTAAQIAQKTLELQRKPKDVDKLLLGTRFQGESFVELPPAAGTLYTRTNPNEDWKFAGDLHYPTDVNVSGKKSLSLLDQVVFAYQSFKGVVYFAVDRPDRLKRIDERLQRQLREHEKQRVLEKRAQIMSDLKQEILDYCSKRFRS